MVRTIICNIDDLGKTIGTLARHKMNYNIVEQDDDLFFLEIDEYD